jgi:hypothetical protein
MNQFTRRGFVGSLLGVAAAKAFGAQQGGSTVGAERQAGKAAIKITDLQMRHHRPQPDGAHCHRSGHFRLRPG